MGEIIFILSRGLWLNLWEYEHLFEAIKVSMYLTRMDKIPVTMEEVGRALPVSCSYGCLGGPQAILPLGDVVLK